MFADYRVPQVCYLPLVEGECSLFQILLGLGALKYSDHLTSLLQKHVEYHSVTTTSESDLANPDKYLDYGSDLEIEIRGCSIHAVSLIKAELSRMGIQVNDILLDFCLWDLAKSKQEEIKTFPIHRTRSIYY